MQRTLYAHMLICTHTLAKTANAHIIKHLKPYPDTQEIVTGTHMQTFTHFHLPGYQHAKHGAYLNSIPLTFKDMAQLHNSHSRKGQGGRPWLSLFDPDTERHPKSCQHPSQALEET